MRREKLTYRAFCVAQSGSEITVPLLLKEPPSPPNIVMVFSGQGAQWAGMAKDLIQLDTKFRQDIEAMDDILGKLANSPNWTIESKSSQ